MRVAELYRKRFVSLFDKTKTCWVWRSAAKSKIRPRFQIKHKSYLAYRIAYVIYKGAIHKGLQVCHSCDNIYCVNPNHLWLGTQKQNLQDCRNKQRHMHGVDHTGTRLTNSKVLAIRKSKSLYKNICAKYNISLATVSRIKNKKVWRHLK